MGTDTKVRVANRSDIEGIVELQKHIYYEYNRDAPFFAWQCFENVNPSILIVAQQGTSIVGTFGIQKIKTTDNLYGGQISWIIIAKDKRRRGLFAKMGDLALEGMPGLDFIFIFANKEAIFPCEKVLGMKFIGKLSQLISKNTFSGIHPESCLEPVTVKTKFNEFPCYKNETTFLRTERYRQWRYAHSTAHKYFKVSIPSGEYAIIKLFNEKRSSPTIGDIVDFECDLLDIPRLQHLFHAASFELRNMGATSITTWAVPGSKLRCVLEEMGFAQSDYYSSLGVRVFHQKDSHLYDFNTWHLVQSDASNY